LSLSKKFLFNIFFPYSDRFKAVNWSSAEPVKIDPDLKSYECEENKFNKSHNVKVNS